MTLEIPCAIHSIHDRGPSYRRLGRFTVRICNTNLYLNVAEDPSSYCKWFAGTSYCDDHGPQISWESLPDNVREAIYNKVNKHEEEIYAKAY